MEQTLIVFKPDTIKRGLIGEILSRFERVGLKIIGMKMVQVDSKLASTHYPDSLADIIGKKTKVDWDNYGVEYTETPEEIGRIILDATREFMTSAPVVAIVLEGGHAVEVVRKLVGSTGPKDSAPGTIRGDYAHLSLGKASAQKKGAANLIHASGTVDEAINEIKLWFRPEELFDYRLSHEDLTHV
ncbi:MAG TPA: nucleoside-diphosphate kinase [Candidatus Saccharimonadales bacterium]